MTNLYQYIGRYGLGDFYKRIQTTLEFIRKAPRPVFSENTKIIVKRISYFIPIVYLVLISESGKESASKLSFLSFEITYHGALLFLLITCVYLIMHLIYEIYRDFHDQRLKWDETTSSLEIYIAYIQLKIEYLNRCSDLFEKLKEQDLNDLKDFTGQLNSFRSEEIKGVEKEYYDTRTQLSRIKATNNLDKQGKQKAERHLETSAEKAKKLFSDFESKIDWLNERLYAEHSFIKKEFEGELKKIKNIEGFLMFKEALLAFCNALFFILYFAFQWLFAILLPAGAIILAIIIIIGRLNIDYGGNIINAYFNLFL